MKKIFAILTAALLSTSILTACGEKSSAEKIVVGASAVPHAEILENVREDLKELGYDLEVKIFNDYVLPNTALSEGQLDANFFQHIPYLEEMNTKENLGLTWTVKVHLEPMGLYSEKITSLDELKEGALIAIPNDATNGSRALKLLAANGLITLKDTEIASVLDITSNEKNLTFKELDAPALPRTLVDVDAAVINTNYAIEGNLNPLEDAIVIESAESPYANVLAVKEENKDSEKTKALNTVLNSEKTKKFIEEKYENSIFPAF
ncbi:MetQ/NlpA family ABC transporter substrate-binding protein [Proteiniclasticum ruminis]|uniref:D-methionine transport system substrate-binding protein n=1 Tax=Proteiniclasticum ruminis TaxID=398199 RepID=A0A1G8NBZ9_9CLOT|nr:MetQ/NlpA family ABC transporter substrate-binding protein [Proteiniclasticum ruminis]SDI77655.1 D-methionine transport system substrate-binding protein [Proteiniclasticum ruminis]